MDKYTCAVCGGVFDRETPEGEALAELHEQFGEDISVDECDIVCDNCWQKVRPDRNKATFEKWHANRGVKNTKQGGSK